MALGLGRGSGEGDSSAQPGGGSPSWGRQQLMAVARLAGVPGWACSEGRGGVLTRGTTGERCPRSPAQGELHGEGPSSCGLEPRVPAAGPGTFESRCSFSATWRKPPLLPPATRAWWHGSRVGGHPLLYPSDSGGQGGRVCCRRQGGLGLRGLHGIGAPVPPCRQLFCVAS